VKTSVRTSTKAGIDPADSRIGMRARALAFLKEHGVPALIGLTAVIAITAIMTTLSEYFVKDHLIFFYLLPITGIAMYFSSTPAVVALITSAIGAAYFLFPPIYSFRIDEPLQIVELLIFSMFAFIAAKASSRLMR
jgi:two-component system, OmpR family, sensor histidine kinase KdpD